MNTPNQVTLLRVLLIPLFLYFLLAKSLPAGNIIAAVFFIGLSLTDAIDGYLARKLNQKTDFGALIDPLADKVLTYGAFLAFVESGMISSVLVLLLLARDFAVMGIRTWASKKGTIIAASDLGKWKTAMQMAAIVFMILALPMWQVLFAFSFFLSMWSGWEYLKQFDLEGI